MSVRVLMLGWEFPPFITGGLGTACYGLTKAMDRAGMKVSFVLPKAVEEEPGSSHVQLFSPGLDMGDPINDFSRKPSAKTSPGMNGPMTGGEREVLVKTIRETFKSVNFVDLPVNVDSVYQDNALWQRLIDEGLEEERLHVLMESGALKNVPGFPAMFNPDLDDDDIDEFGIESQTQGRSSNAADYGGDLIGQANAYAHFCQDVARRVEFDVIHAHDWLTFPAGMAVARLSGRPLVVHVHSTEFDRSGEHVNQTVYNIERRGMRTAVRVVAVSELTKKICASRYGVSSNKVDVVYNGVDFETSNLRPIETKDKIVLFFGRITMQKGPEYFLQAAKRVLDVEEDVKFVVAGSGDLAAMMIEMAADMGIGHKVLFTGFLRGKDIARVFSLADLYVMPSVSEPFGIAPLEAMSHDVPALISKSSGVSEVLSHALKVDFWDVEEMANKIVAVLRHAPLSKALRDNGRFEVRSLTWDGAATRCARVYEQALEQMDATV